MTNLRDNFVWIIGSVTTTIAAAISWFISSEIFITLISVLIGFISSYILQTMTQKNAWKREYSVKIVEEVYGTLFKAIKSVVLQLEKKRYWQLGFNEWMKMQDEYRYYMVDEKFRERLDRFFESIGKYNDVVSRVRREIVLEIMWGESEKIFKTNIEGQLIHVEIRTKGKGSRLDSHKYDISECLVCARHPKDALLEAQPEAEIVDFTMTLGQTPASSDNISRFDKFWESCIRKLNTDEDYQSLLQKNDRLLEEAESIKKELAKRIEEPWQI